MSSRNLHIKRVYEPASGQDGFRILVDALWPRGLSKETVQANEWLKHIAPSTTLRKWFNHEPEKWEEFVKRYHAELKGATALLELTAYIKQHKTVTLLYAAHDETHNNARALLEYMKSH